MNSNGSQDAIRKQHATFIGWLRRTALQPVKNFYRTPNPNGEEGNRIIIYTKNWTDDPTLR